MKGRGSAGVRELAREGPKVNAELIEGDKRRDDRRSDLPMVPNEETKNILAPAGERGIDIYIYDLIRSTPSPPVEPSSRSIPFGQAAHRRLLPVPLVPTLGRRR